MERAVGIRRGVHLLLKAPHHRLVGDALRRLSLHLLHLRRRLVWPCVQLLQSFLWRLDALRCARDDRELHASPLERAVRTHGVRQEPPQPAQSLPPSSLRAL